MKTYEYRDGDGAVISFEIPNIGRTRARRVVERHFPDTVVERQRGDEFGTFVLNGRTFVLTEPWGDNSRYLVHERDPKPSRELETLRKTLAGCELSWSFSGSPSFIVFIAIAAILITIIVVVIFVLRH